MSENKENTEKVVLETTVKNPNKEPVVKLNEAHASMDIAKNLIQDYTFILTMSVVKSILSNTKNAENIINNLTDVWEKRMSAQIAEETKAYETAIHQAFEGQGVVSEETSKKIKEYMDMYCSVRDKAVAMAKDGVKGINNMIFSKSTEQKKEN